MTSHMKKPAANKKAAAPAKAEKMPAKLSERFAEGKKSTGMPKIKTSKPAKAKW